MPPADTVRLRRRTKTRRREDPKKVVFGLTSKESSCLRAFVASRRAKRWTVAEPIPPEPAASRQNYGALVAIAQGFDADDVAIVALDLEEV